MSISVTLIETKNSSTASAFTFAGVDLVAGERLLIIAWGYRNVLSTWYPALSAAVTDTATAASGWAYVGSSSPYPSYSAVSGQSAIVALMSNTLTAGQSGVSVTLDFDTGNTSNYVGTVAVLLRCSSTSGTIICHQATGAPALVAGSTQGPDLRWTSPPLGRVIMAYGATSTLTVGSAPTGTTALSTTNTSGRSLRVYSGISRANPVESFSWSHGSGISQALHYLGIELVEEDPGVAAPEVRAGAGTSVTSATTSWVVNLPAAVTYGDQLVVALHASNSDLTARTFTGPAGWTLIRRYTASSVSLGRAHVVEWWAKDEVDGTEDGGTATWTLSSAGFGVAYAMSISGVAAPPAAGTEAGSGNSTTSSPNPSGYGVGGVIQTLYLAWHASVDDGATTSGYPSSFTHHAAAIQSGGGTNAAASMAIAARRAAGPIVDPSSFTLSSSQKWLAGTIAVGGSLPEPPPPDPPAGVVFVAEGERSLLDGTWSTSTTSTVHLLLDGELLDGLTDIELDALTASDFTVPSFTGYAGEAATSAGWSTTPGTPTVSQHADVSYAASGDPAAPVTVYGYYVLRNSDGALIYFEIFERDDRPVIEADGDSVTFGPAFAIRGSL